MKGENVMLKKLLVGIAAAAMLFAFAPKVDAHPGQHFQTSGYYEHSVTGALKYFRHGHPGPRSQWTLVEPYNPCGGACDDAIALAETGIVIVSPYEVADIQEMGYGFAGGKDLELSGMALATGKDKRFFFWKIPGFAWADVNLDLVASVFTRVRTTGEMLEGGLSLTAVKSIGTLKVKADAIAIGNNGCPQWAEVNLSGMFTTTAGGYAYSEGDNGAFAGASGEGTTGVLLSAHDSDFDKHGWFIFPPTAHASIEGFVIVQQGAFFAAYTSPDGMTTATFAMVKGGEAVALGDVNIEGIKAKGNVMQSSMAADGMGAFAYGHSSASFKGAEGYVAQGRCADYANANGMAMVTGYNNITHTGNSVSITSHHTATATTGNFGFGGQPQ